MLYFIETRFFSRRVGEFLDDDGLRDLQKLIEEDPERGAVIKGCGGLRKIRCSHMERGKGKRGGCRVIYLNLSEFNRIDLIAIYGKGEQDDLSDEQKKALCTMAEMARAEATRHASRRKEKR